MALAIFFGRKSGLALALGSSLVLAAGPAQAQTWRPLPVHGGGYITGIFATPADTNKILARCDVAGVFRSDNRGDTWRNLTAALPKYNNTDLQVRSLVADDSFDDLLYLGGGAPYSDYSRLWHTANGGASWQSRPLPFTVNGNGYLRSAGETLWRNPSNFDDLVAAGQPVFDYAAGQWRPSAGLFRSVDGGANWQKIGGAVFDQANVAGLKPQPGTGNDVFYVAVVRETMASVGTPRQGLWRWVRSTNALTQVLSGEDVVDFDFDAGRPSRLVTTQAAGIRTSADGGQTWSALQQPFGYAYDAFVTAHPTEAGHWYFGSWTGYTHNALVETRDGGLSFAQTRYNDAGNRARLAYPPALATGFRPTFANASSQLLLHPTRPNLAYTADWYGVWRSANAAGPLLDAGQPSASNARWNWTYATVGIHNVVGLRANRLPGSPGRFVFGIADESYYNSPDAGVSMVWDPAYYMNNVYAAGFARRRPNVGYLVGTYYSNGSKLVKTVDGGLTFGPVSGFLDAAACVNDVAVSATGDTLVCGVDRGALASPLYVSYDGGRTWADWAQGLPWANVFKTWEGVSHLLSDADGRTVYVWRDNAIYRRRWADAAWQAVPVPAAAGWLASVKTDYSVPGKLYVACWAPNLYVSANGGGAWAAIPTPGQFVDGFAVADDGKLLARESADAARPQALYLYTPASGAWATTRTDQVAGLLDDLEFIGPDVAVAWSHHTGGYRLALATAPLPVELTGFNAQRRDADALLRWATAGETRCRGFGVEVAAGEGQAFRSLGFVAAAGGRGPVPRAYAFCDAEPGKTGVRYYRLRQEDEDGQVRYFGPHAVRFAAPPAGAAQLTAYPNPATRDELTLRYDAPVAGPVVVQVLDPLGRVLLTHAAAAVAGPNAWALPLPGSVPNGAATLRLVAADGQVLHRGVLVLR